jgi:hypothetical protein
MRQLQILALLVLAAAIAYAGFQFTNGFGQRGAEAPTYVINGECQAAVGYREKHVIGTFVALPVKKMTCSEYYFHEKPSSKYSDVKIVLVRLNTGEYHWILENLLVMSLQR